MEVITAPPFPPSNTTWDESAVSIRHEQRDIPGIDIELSIDPEATMNIDKNKMSYLIKLITETVYLLFKNKTKAHKLCYEFRDFIDDKLGAQLC